MGESGLERQRALGRFVLGRVERICEAPKRATKECCRWKWTETGGITCNQCRLELQKT